MTTTKPSAQESRASQPTAGLTWQMFVRFVIYTLLVSAILFVAAGTLNWLMGWLYVGVTLTLVVISRVLLARKYPDLITERARYADREGAKEWDKVLVLLVAMIGPLVMLAVAGLDKRFGWSPEIALWFQLVALALVALATVFSVWAMLTNKFFSAVVRIQTDRGHVVVSSGPYATIRHPGYAAGVVANLAGPLALGSLVALIPGFLTVCIIIVRTVLEDRTLQAELPGYKEYTQKVRYRLLPGLW